MIHSCDNWSLNLCLFKRLTFENEGGTWGINNLASQHNALKDLDPQCQGSKNPESHLRESVQVFVICFI